MRSSGGVQGGFQGDNHCFFFLFNYKVKLVLKETTVQGNFQDGIHAVFMRLLRGIFQRD